LQQKLRTFCLRDARSGEGGGGKSIRNAVPLNNLEKAILLCSQEWFCWRSGRLSVDGSHFSLMCGRQSLSPLWWGGGIRTLS